MKRSGLSFSKKDSANTSPVKFIKSKVYSFQNLFQNGLKKQITNPIIQSEDEQNFSFCLDYCLKPKLKSKKILQDPKFFVSVQRKKIKSLKNYDYQGAFNKKIDQKLSKKIKQNKTLNNSIDRILKCKSEMKRSSSPFFQNQRKRLKQSLKSTPYLNSAGYQKDQSEIIQVQRQIRNRTPNLHYNMQYLIKKRKMAPNTNKCKRVYFTHFMSEQLSGDQRL